MEPYANSGLLISYDLKWNWTKDRGPKWLGASIWKSRIVTLAHS